MELNIINQGVECCDGFGSGVSDDRGPGRTVAKPLSASRQGPRPHFSRDVTAPPVDRESGLTPLPGRLHR
jgi:hypothetical protein